MHALARTLVPALALLLHTTSCSSPPEVDGEVGVTDYVLENRTSLTLDVRFEVVAGDEVGPGNLLCAPGATCPLVRHGGRFGVNPLPEDTFSSIAAFVEEQGAWREVYRQEPIVNARWTLRGQPAAFTPCCEERTLTLTLSDADLDVR